MPLIRIHIVHCIIDVLICVGVQQRVQFSDNSIINSEEPSHEGSALSHG